jgi:hypothetical protein
MYLGIEILIWLINIHGGHIDDELEVEMFDGGLITFLFQKI